MITVPAQTTGPKGPTGAGRPAGNVHPRFNFGPHKPPRIWEEFEAKHQAASMLKSPENNVNTVKQD